jgi:hypothetical protein
LAGSEGIAVSGSDLFVTHGNTVPEYTTAGALVDAALISGLADPVSIAPSGSDLFVVNQAGSVGEYTTAGAAVNAALITGLNGPVGIAIGGAPAVPEPRPG